MTNKLKKRTFIKGGAVLWVAPVVYGVSLPAHAQTSTLIVTSTGFDVFNVSCAESLPVQISFSLTNSSGADVTLNSLSSSQFVHVSPTLPINISNTETVVFTVRGADTSVQCIGNYNIDYN